MRAVIPFLQTDSQRANHSPAFSVILIFRRRTFALLGASLFALTLNVSCGYAQGSKVAAAIEGSVKDGSGAVIAAATVTVVNPSTNQVRAMETDEEGIFHAQALPVGSYEVRANHD